MDPTEDMRKHFTPAGVPVVETQPPVPVTSHMFCSWCKAGPLFSWQRCGYAGEIVCRDCKRTAEAVDDANC